MAINRDFFFDTVRAQLFGGKLSQSQVTGMSVILDVWEADHDRKDDRWLAYMFATAFHETAMTMRPIQERGGDSYYNRLYGVEGDNPARARKNGNTDPGDGARYCGRGYVQLTWKNNYQLMSAVVGVDLVAEPQTAMQPDVAANVMFHGMEAGTFTGRKLADYFSPDNADWLNARKIINGLDRAPLVALYGKAFYSGISYTTA